MALFSRCPCDGRRGGPFQGNAFQMFRRLEIVSTCHGAVVLSPQDRRVEARVLCGVCLLPGLRGRGSRESGGSRSLYTRRGPLSSIRLKSRKGPSGLFGVDLCSFCLQVLSGESTQGTPGRPVPRPRDPGDGTLQGAQQRPEPLYSCESKFSPFLRSESDSFKPSMPSSRSLFLLPSLLASGFLTTPSCWTWPRCLGDHLLSQVPISAPRPVL